MSWCRARFAVREKSKIAFQIRNESDPPQQSTTKRTSGLWALERRGNHYWPEIIINQYRAVQWHLLVAVWHLTTAFPDAALSLWSPRRRWRHTGNWTSRRHCPDVHFVSKSQCDCLLRWSYRGDCDAMRLPLLLFRWFFSQINRWSRRLRFDDRIMTDKVKVAVRLRPFNRRGG